MITKEQIINARFESTGYDNEKEYQDKVAKILEDYEVIGGHLDDEDYSEEIYVLMRKDGKYYEFHSSHCSCNGFDDFEPEEVELEALRMRKKAWNGCIGELTQNALEEAGLQLPMI